MLSIPWLEAGDTWFPPPSAALSDPDGLLAVGGDLSPERLLAAYRQGIFPWYEPGQPILWWSPDPRTVFLPGDFHISRSLRKCLRRSPFRVTLDTAFEQVITHCGAPRGPGEGTWITDEMHAAYCRLHQLGHAHSAEVWRDGQLVGGLYGVGIGRAFFGESMFSRADNASKVALAHLSRRLDEWGFGVFDAQVASAHLFTLGARQIPREDFQALLLDCVEMPAPAPPWRLPVEGYDWS